MADLLLVAKVIIPVAVITPGTVMIIFSDHLICFHRMIITIIIQVFTVVTGHGPTGIIVASPFDSMPRIL